MFPPPARVYVPIAAPTPPELLLRTDDYRPSGLEFDAAAEDYVVLRQVMPDGREGRSYRLPDDALENLPEILRRLPDDRYRIYQVRSDGPDRLVRDVYVRQGVVIESGDASEGIFDRPPQSQSWEEPQQPTIDSPDMPEGAEQGNVPEFEAIDRAWAGWHAAPSRASDRLVKSAAGGAEMDSPPPDLPDQAVETNGPCVAAGVSAALLSFRLRSGWHQQLDAAMSKFKRSSAGRRRGGPRPGQPR